MELQHPICPAFLFLSVEFALTQNKLSFPQPLWISEVSWDEKGVLLLPNLMQQKNWLNSESDRVSGLINSMKLPFPVEIVSLCSGVEPNKTKGRVQHMQQGEYEMLGLSSCSFWVNKRQEVWFASVVLGLVLLRICCFVIST